MIDQSHIAWLSHTQVACHYMAQSQTNSMYLPLVYGWNQREVSTDTFSGIGNATGATGIITEFVRRIPLNSKVDSTLKSDGTRRDESPTSTTGTGTSITSRRLVTILVDESATVNILCRTPRMEREGDKDLWPRRGMLWTKEILKLIGCHWSVLIQRWSAQLWS